MNNPLVSICSITYGHGKYIQDTIKGVLSQNVNFPVEFIIADDCSPDETEKEVNRFISSHENGHWINYTRHSLNKGMNSNFLWALNKCKGKYIALCEGDDYWTDSLKLQKQVDFLQANKNYVMSFHDVIEVDENSVSLNQQNEKRTKRKTYSPKEMLLAKIMPTASNVIRGDELRSLLSLPKIDQVFNMDTFIHAHLSRYGGAYYHENMVAAAYRVHPGGVWTRAGDNYRAQESLKTTIAIYETIDDHDSKEIVKNTILKYYLQMVKYKAKRLKMGGVLLNTIRLLKFLMK